MADAPPLVSGALLDKIRVSQVHRVIDAALAVYSGDPVVRASVILALAAQTILDLALADGTAQPLQTRVKRLMREQEKMLIRLLKEGRRTGRIQE